MGELTSVSERKGRIIFVVGPTATGKSDLAVSLAEVLRAEVINADSIQFYNQIEAGTAKPGPDLTNRVLHHLLSFVDPPHTLSAGDFVRAAETVLSERGQAGTKNFVIVGGSGFYIQALDRGMVAAPKVSDEVREQVSLKFKSEGSESLWNEVEKRDPEYAAKVSKNDSYRVQRALEILLSGPKSITEAQREFAAQKSHLQMNYHIQKIGLDLDRNFLRSRIGQRTEQMLAHAWIDEVRQLRDRGFSEWAPLRSVGYLEVGEFLDSRIRKQELPEKITTSTLQLAKKQRTWFKRDREIHWILRDKSDPEGVFSDALKILKHPPS